MTSADGGGQLCVILTTNLLQIWDNADFGTVIAYASMINNFSEDVLMAFTGLDSVSSPIAHTILISC